MPDMTIPQMFDVALSHHRQGRLHAAEQLYRQILSQQPEHADALHYLGVIAHQTGQHDLAMELIGKAIALVPHQSELYHNLGNALQAKGQLDQAMAVWRQAIALDPSRPGSFSNLGNVLKDKGRLDEAIAAFHQAIALNPNYAEAYNNLGYALQALGLSDEAIVALHRAIALKPNYAEAYCNLGNALKDQGQLDEAIAAFRQALALRPDYAPIDSNLIFDLHYHPGWDAAAIARELRRWNQQHAEPLKQFSQPFANNRDPERRLRIGYVSPGFGDHPVGWFLQPLLAQHDHQRFEVFAYAHVPAPDAVTQRLASYTDVWRDLVGQSDARAAELIRRDRIDVLVDLALHTGHNRLLIFAYKPAPVQVTYLAYAGTSGLTTMDYRLSDPYLDPPGMDESVYREQTIRLPHTFWCYGPLVQLPPQTPPALANGLMTFGCLNNFCKVNEPLLHLWAQVLHAVPNSRLLLHAHPGHHRQRVLDFMQRHGIASTRLSLAGKVPREAYFAQYQAIDIALDTHPFGGGTTTCDALWMGVPVVSLAGQTAVSRAGLSILTNVGLPELVAHTADEYVQIAAALAHDLPRLKELHATLRQRMRTSPLMDAPRFARDIEAAYRQMWRQWCAMESETAT